MTVDNAPARLPSLPATPGRVGQGTAVEQSRATAEVYSRVLVAQQVPRDEARAVAEMRKACSNLRLANRAFYSVPKGNDRATGPSVHLARELARIWGNIDYGVHELLRDDAHGQSEILAFAWDLQTNARSAQIFIQPHKMDTKRGVKHLTEVQAIYESNANAGARRVREAIFAVLPADFLDEAQELCRATVERGDGTPLDQRRTKAIGAYLREFGVTERQLVDRLRRAVDRWDEQDVADLQVLYGSLKRREVRVEVEFPAETQVVTLAELAPAEPAAAAEKPAVSDIERQADEQSVGTAPTAEDAAVVDAFWAGEQK